MRDKIVTIDDERPANKGEGKCFYCHSKIGEKHTNECAHIQFPSLNDPLRDELPNGWIQWKGTNVCIDLYCKCGKQFHYDGDFMYHVKCPYCNQVYEVGGHVKLYPLDFEPEMTIEFKKEE